jgi:hypothetical protein
MVTSLGLAYLSSHRTGDSIITDAPAVEQQLPAEQAIPGDTSANQPETPAPKE